MNAIKVQTLINQLIAEQQERQVTRKQYPVSKAQIAKLTELGILNLMPAKFGYTDAAVVIEAATTAKSAIMNAFGEGEEVPANPLNVALTAIDTDEEISDEHDYTDNLIDEVSAMENEAFNRTAEIEMDKNTDWSY